ncbi:MAG TPA: hypothetical protein DIC23_08275 [Planctomycetaceae bacterium]|nr:hypothetical protein [Planctomycetaceae bacterium]
MEISSLDGHEPVERWNRKSENVGGGLDGGGANMRRAGGPSKMVASTSRRSLLLRVTPIKLTVPCLGPCDRWPRGE